MSSDSACPDLRPVETGTEIRQRVGRLRAAGRRVGLVPTMGALHDGHLSLVRASREQCDETVVTIFVNPVQFAPREDFQSYPRPLDRDLELLREAGVEHVFVPKSEEMYPRGFSTFVEPPQIASEWEGRFRPGHFRGVTTVVLKLFHLVPAHVAYFGEKDYQQLLVIRQMIADLNLPIELGVCPTVRDPDGLALSSRNRYLSVDQRQQACAIPASLRQAQRLFEQGERQASVLAAAVEEILSAAGVARVDYVAVVDPDTLSPLDQIRGEVSVLVAAYVGSTRLIDNVRLSAARAG